MTRLLLSTLLATSISASSAMAIAPDAKQLIDDQLVTKLDALLNSEIVKISVRNQNEKYAKLSQAEINKLDEQWKQERKGSDKPLIAATLSSPLSIYLARFQGRSAGLFVEVFVMDDKGLNVGQSSITSDFWQGDEAKYQKTFLKGADAVFIDEPEWDEGLKIWRAQISKPIVDKGNTPIGAVTFEINLTELERRHAANATN